MGWHASQQGGEQVQLCSTSYNRFDSVQAVKLPVHADEVSDGDHELENEDIETTGQQVRATNRKH